MLNIEKTVAGFRLSGILSAASAKGALFAGTDILRKSDDQEITIDCSSLTSIDSTATSVILEWMRIGKECEKTIICHGVSDSFESLIKVYGLSQVIPFGVDEGG